MGTLQSELIRNGLVKKKPKKPHKNKKRSKKSKPLKQPKPKIETLSRREWEEIMGTKRPKFKRHKGAFRQI